jgi:hypothetical protein
MRFRCCRFDDGHKPQGNSRSASSQDPILASDFSSRTSIVLGVILKLMSTQVTCHCGKRFLAQPHLAGKRVACPACGGTIDVPKSERRLTPSSPQPSSIVVGCRCGQGEHWGTTAFSSNAAGERHWGTRREGGKLAARGCGQLPVQVAGY